MYVWSQNILAGMYVHSVEFSASRAMRISVAIIYNIVILRYTHLLLLISDTCNHMRRRPSLVGLLRKNSVQYTL